jgi:ABC-type transport system substrate-binding protein
VRISSNGRTYVFAPVFAPRQDVHFHNGAVMAAEGVIASIER